MNRLRCSGYRIIINAVNILNRRKAQVRMVSTDKSEGKKPLDVEILPIYTHDGQKVFEFLLKHFYPDEPLHMGLNHKGPSINSKHLSPTPQTIKQNMSLKAVSTANPDVLYGVCLCDSLMRIKQDDYWITLLSQKFEEGHKTRVILDFVRYINVNFIKALEDTYWRDASDDAFDITIIAVHKEFRGRHVASKMVERAIRNAKAQNYRWMVTQGTNAYTVKLALKFKFKPIYILPYEDYKDDQGRVVFKPPPPSTAFVALLKDLDED